MCHLSPAHPSHLVSYCLPVGALDTEALGPALTLCFPAPVRLFLQRPLLGGPFPPMATGLIPSFSTWSKATPSRKPTLILLLPSVGSDHTFLELPDLASVVAFSTKYQIIVSMVYILPKVGSKLYCILL